MTSANDRAVLNSIFNPLLPIGELIYDEDIPEDLKDDSVDKDDPIMKRVSDLELKGVKSAEEGDVVSALATFNEAIQLAPRRPSCYNNRAQALRLMGKTKEAMSDLNTALELSNGKGKAACQAYVQRGLLNRLHHKDDEAKKDFEKATGLGSEFAKAQLAQMNPYAALCNKMLHDVFTKLQQGLPI